MGESRAHEGEILHRPPDGDAERLRAIPRGREVQRLDEGAGCEQRRLHPAHAIRGSKTALSGHDPLILAAGGVADPQRYVAFARPVVLGRPLETEHQERRRGQRVRKTVQQQRRAERETQRFCLRSVDQPLERLWNAQRAGAGEQRVQRVVQVRDRWTQSRPQHVAHAAQPVGQRGKPDAADPPLWRARPDAQPRRGEDRERAFAAEQQRRKVRPAARTVEGAEDLARAVDRLEGQNHVRDAAVARGEHSRATRGEPATDGCAGQ